MAVSNSFTVTSSIVKELGSPITAALVELSTTSTSTSSTAKPEISAESVITYGAFDTPGFSIDTIEGASSKVPLTDLACNSLSPTEKQGEQ